MSIDIKKILYEDFVTSRMEFDSFSSCVLCERVSDEIESQLTKKQRIRFSEYKIFVEEYHKERYRELIDYIFEFYKGLK